jgi:tetratricopeptide (TPR) repeat protein
MADRYTYIPLIGIFIMLAWGVADLFQEMKYRSVYLAGTAVIILIFMAVLSWYQVKYWQDSLRLFQHAANVTINNHRAHHQLGLFFMKQGDYDHAMHHLVKTLQINPDSRSAHNNIGIVLAYQGRINEAKLHFIKALQIKPDDPTAHNNLGAALDALGQKKRGKAPFF